MGEWSNMGQYDFTYELPADFTYRVMQILQQTACASQVAIAFQHCTFEYEDLGLAYYAGLKGDNWNKHALEFTFEGSRSDIDILRNGQSVLKEAMTRGLRSSVSGFLIKNILFLVGNGNILPSTDDERLNIDLAVATAVLNDLIKISERLSVNAAYKKDTPENVINDSIRDMLLLIGYNEVRDQTRHGISATGKDAGEVDILISKAGREIAIFEGLKLSSVDSSYIDRHLSKTIVNYNALGTATFIVAYVSNSDFESFWYRYVKHIEEYNYPLQIKRTLKIEAAPNAATRIAHMILSRDGYDFPVYFMAIKIN